MQYALIVVIAAIVVIIAVGRVARIRNVPQVEEEYVEETPQIDVNALKAQFFNIYYEMVIVLDHETRMEMFEIRDRRSKRILAYVDDQWTVQLYQQTTQKGHT